jgi:prepilin-type N-terminal cleavage/methylation domain-containing protein
MRNEMKSAYGGKKEKGFTLIELLVVIAIIGILAILIFVALQRAQRGARDATRKSGCRDIATAEAMYYDATKSYTGNLTALMPATNPYLSQVPQVCAQADDTLPCGSHTTYNASWDAALGTATGFTCTANLENGGTFVCDKSGCR